MQADATALSLFIKKIMKAEYKKAIIWVLFFLSGFAGPTV